MYTHKCIHICAIIDFRITYVFRNNYNYIDRLTHLNDLIVKNKIEFV